MKTILTDLTLVDLIYLACAVLGGLLLIVRMALQFLGMDHHGDGDLGAGDVGDAGHGDFGFRLLSVQGLTGFFLMFGLVGLAMSKQSRTGIALSFVGATAAGLFTVWLIAKLLHMMLKLQSSGTLSLEDAVGCRGEVYLNIPAKGVGIVLVKVSGRLREFEAMEKDGKELKTGTPVTVSGLAGTKLLVSADLSP
ncbi:MAG: hypothetical protein AB1921_04485 [Thermodesulfobacteriota bacterium]